MREIYSVLLNLKTTPKNTPMVCVETMCVQGKSGETREEMKQVDDDVSPSVEAKSEDDFNSEDDGSPRGVLEMCASDSHCDSPSSIDKALIPVVAAAEGHNRLRWRKVIAAIKKKSFSAISKRSLPAAAAAPQHTIHFEPPLLTNKPSWTTFNYHQLAAATANFSAENLIGKGGHAEVYKGQLLDGQLVAVKRLTRKQNEEERTGDFLSELGIIAHIDHPNAARLLGFGVDGGLHLVLQFSPNGSLASLLHGTEGCLDWGVRFRVALGVAQGLNYLHKGCHRRIIHRDIKASNILLTKDYEPQISDFGLAKWLPEQWAHHIVFPIEGTFGYLAPEYFMHGIIDEKTDVFAFGVLLLELITGRRAVDSSQLSLVLWAKPLLDTNNVKELIDPRLGDAYDLTEMKNVIFTASMCIHHLSTRRPNMTRVGQLLKGVNGSLEVMGREQKPHIGRALMLDSCDLEDYTCSTYLKDLNRHRKLALE